MWERSRKEFPEKDPDSVVRDLLSMIGSAHESPAIPSNISEEGKDFLRCCFARNPARRSTASELLNNKYVMAFKEEGERKGSERVVKETRSWILKGSVYHCLQLMRRGHLCISGAFFIRFPFRRYWAVFQLQHCSWCLSNVYKYIRLTSWECGVLSFLPFNIKFNDSVRMLFNQSKIDYLFSILFFCYANNFFLLHLHSFFPTIYCLQRIMTLLL